MKTKNGYPVELLAVLGPGEEAEGKAYVGILIGCDERSVETWTRDGRYLPDRESQLDLVIPPVDLRGML